jgi:electron transport complex protein RnfD
LNSNPHNLVLSTSPFLKRPVNTPLIMRHVIYSLAPVALAAIWFFGVSALLLILTCIGGCMASEMLFEGKVPFRQRTVTDGSAALTGLLLALTLPPGLPLWMALVGSLAAIVVGKIMFGGLGQNVFNPSLTGRAFLQGCFPVPLTTWVAPGSLRDFFTLRGDTFALPFTNPEFDALSAATPLAKMKFDAAGTPLADLFFGNISGSLGETSALLILLGGAYLAWRRFLNWRIPAGIFITIFAFATILHLANPERFPDGFFHLLSGGLMLGAVYMATDPVTSPVTPRGSWIFAAGLGILVVAIREFGGLAEGVMYSILFMNACTPLIDRFTQPRTYGELNTENEPGESRG